MLRMRLSKILASKKQATCFQAACLGEKFSYAAGAAGFFSLALALVFLRLR
jgi:hypothetical protein